MNTHSNGSGRLTFAAAALIVTALSAHFAPAYAAPTQAPQVATPVAQVTSPALQSGAVSPTAADIHDIRGPKLITSPWLIPLSVATALLALGGAYAAWAWQRRRFREASKLPLDIALERLENACRLMETPFAREFSIEVSDAVRDHIESRFDLRAAHLTTDEFLHRLLEPDSPLAAHRSLLEHFLGTCDLAKFGAWNLALADMQDMLQSARRFIVDSAADMGSHGNPSQRVPTAATTPGKQPPTPISRETYVSLPST